jgi:hypothetical protein
VTISVRKARLLIFLPSPLLKCRRSEPTDRAIYSVLPQPPILINQHHSKSRIFTLRQHRDKSKIQSARCDMDYTYTDEEDEALSRRIQRLLELQRQGQSLSPPQPPSIWETWFDTAMTGIAHAVLVDAIWPTRFWWAILRFCVAKPVVTGRLVHGVFKVYYDGDWNAEAARQYVDAWLVVGGYAATHLLYRVLGFLFVFGRYLLRLVLTHSLWVCTACGVLVGLKFLMRGRSIRLTNIGWRLIHHALDLGSGMMILHFRFSVFYRKLWASIKRSSGIKQPRFV